MWQKLSKKKKAEYLKKWIAETLKDETELSLKRHIIKHAKEIHKKDPEGWIASMKNLTDAFELMKDVKTNEDVRLKKLHIKYLKNKKRYTPPPKVSLV